MFGFRIELNYYYPRAMLLQKGSSCGKIVRRKTSILFCSTKDRSTSTKPKTATSSVRVVVLVLLHDGVVDSLNLHKNIRIFAWMTARFGFLYVQQVIGSTFRLTIPQESHSRQACHSSAQVELLLFFRLKHQENTPSKWWKWARRRWKSVGKS